MKTTTAKCSVDEKEHIRNEAHKRGQLMRPFIGYVLDKYLPLSFVNTYNQDIPRNTSVGVKLSEELEKRLEKNIKELSTPYVIIKMFEMVLTCVDLECEK